jgi:hypothetical protein
LGLKFCENPWQGRFIIDELADPLLICMGKRPSTRNSSGFQSGGILKSSSRTVAEGGEIRDPRSRHQV